MIKKEKDEEIQDSKPVITFGESEDSEELEESPHKRIVISTTKPPLPKTKGKIITTRELNAEGKVIGEQRYWDEEKTMKKPALVTSDIPNPEDVEAKKKRDEIIAARKEKVKK